jgi:transposase
MLMPLSEKEKQVLAKPKALSNNEKKKAIKLQKKLTKKERKRNKKIKKIDFDSLDQINIDAAGLDIGADEIFVCVPRDRDENNVRVFKTFTVDLYSLASWLKECNIKTVAMESTGVYWNPVFEILEKQGFDVNLICPRYTKSVPGKKTDVAECQWIQQLHTYGLLASSFRPAAEMAALRSVMRHRSMLVEYRAQHIQHMQKNLELMNLKLCTVLSDITGVTGMKIIRSILEGKRDPVYLAQFRDSNCKASEEDIVKSLEGNYKDEYIFGLQQSLHLYDYYSKLIKECDDQIQEKISAHKDYNAEQALSSVKNKKRKQKNEPDYNLRSELNKLVGVDLCAIDGIGALTAQIIVTEIGLDMDKWFSSKHFCSWLGLCPTNSISGGKVLRRGSKKNTNPATVALRKAARGLHHSKSALGAFYRRMRAKHGGYKANKATAHKLARIIYNMLKNKTEYEDMGADQYQEKYRNKVVNNLKKKAAALGLKLVEA